MALPAGVTTATVTVGVPVTHTGGEVKTFVSIEPSAFLVHAATGTPLVDFLEELQINEGVAGQFTLPHTDQAGFTDDSGNAYTNWYYTARVTYSTPSKAKNKAPKIKVFQLTTGQTVVDLDLLPGGAPALPYTAPTAKVDAFMGRTGTVTLLEADLPARLSEAALTTTVLDLGGAEYARAGHSSLGNGLVALGDSMTIGAAFRTATQEAIGPSWPAYASWATQLKLRLLRNAGVAGNRSDQMLSRFDTDVTPYAPSVVTLLAGTNDISQNIELPVFQANVEAIVAKVIGIGAVPVLATILPRTPSATYGQRVSQWNAWIKSYALANGFALLDFNALMTNPADGALLYDSGDNLHPSQAGYKVMGDYAATVLKPLLREWTPLRPVSNVDPNNLLANALLLTDTTPADGRADGYSTYGSGATYTLEAGVSPVLGNWQKWVNTVAGGGITKSVTTGWAVGDKIAFTGRFDTDGATYIAQMLATGTTNYVRAVGSMTTAVRDGAFYGEMVVPAGTTALEIRFTGGIGTHKVAQLGLFNLTALGLA